MAARFPYLPAASSRGDSALMPLLPVELSLQNNEPVHVHGLLDSGATVNVLPYGLGLRLGARWESQKTAVTLTGNLAAHEARALLLDARIAEFAPVPLVFAWSRAENVPLLLGQVNFFDRFDVKFSGAQRQFEIEPARK
jgi:hypothetical protein